MAGLIHIYCGDGKGKTTAAVGLALRAAGAGKQVMLTQFFKDGSSSEIAMLRQIPGIRVMHCKTVPGFFFRMTPEQEEQCRRDYTQWFRQVTLEVAGADEFECVGINRDVPAFTFDQKGPRATHRIIVVNHAHKRLERFHFEISAVNSAQSERPFNRGLYP